MISNTKGDLNGITDNILEAIQALDQQKPVAKSSE